MSTNHCGHQKSEKSSPQFRRQQAHVTALQLPYIWYAHSRARSGWDFQSLQWGTVNCRVSTDRHHRSLLEQGRLEVPCLCSRWSGATQKTQKDCIYTCTLTVIIFARVRPTHSWNKDHNYQCHAHTGLSMQYHKNLAWWVVTRWTSQTTELMLQPAPPLFNDMILI